MRLQAAWLLISALAVSGHKANDATNPRQAIQAVLDSITKDLVAANRTSLAARYDRSGAVFLGNWGMRTVPFDSIPDVYGPKWTAPVRFHWRNITMDVIDSRNAVVYAQFMWYDSATASSLTQYTGVFRFDGKAWRIRSDHESWQLPCPADTLSK